MEEMMDGVEPDQPFDDQIDGDDDVEEPRHDQNENAGNQRDDRRCLLYTSDAADE